MNSELAKAIEAMTASNKRIAEAITPAASPPGVDATGGYVGSLTEAVMGMTSGLCRIADAIHELADAIQEKE